MAQEEVKIDLATTFKLNSQFKTKIPHLYQLSEKIIEFFVFS